MLKKIIEKLRSGLLQEMILETKWIYSYTARYKKGILLYILLGLCLTAIGLGASIVSKYIIDAVTTQNLSKLLGLGVFYVLFHLGRIALQALSSRISALASSSESLTSLSITYSKVMRRAFDRPG